MAYRTENLQRVYTRLREEAAKTGAPPGPAMNYQNGERVRYAPRDPKNAVFAPGRLGSVSYASNNQDDTNPCAVSVIFDGFMHTNWIAPADLERI